MFIDAITRNHQKLLVLYINTPVLCFCIVRCVVPIIIFYKMFVTVIIYMALPILSHNFVCWIGKVFGTNIKLFIYANQIK